jgi:hypothetical protein
MTQIDRLREAEMYLRLERVAARKNLERAERAEAERDALRAQLDAMTTEWGARFGDRTYNYGPDAIQARATRGDVAVRRLVGPWVDVRAHQPSPDSEPRG